MVHAISIQTADFSLEAEEKLAEASSRNCGALVSFTGKVRGKDHEQLLSHLYLEHFPGVTEQEIEKIILAAQKKMAFTVCKSHPSHWQHQNRRKNCSGPNRLRTSQRRLSG